MGARPRDWLKNVVASGGARLKRHGRTFAVTDPQLVTREEAAVHVTGLSRFAFRRLPFDNAVLLQRA